MNKYLVLITLLISRGLFAQSLNMFDVDASNFPLIQAKFIALDNQKKFITGLTPLDFDVFEDSIPRQIISVNCEPNTEAAGLSSVIVIDASGSMKDNLYLVKEAATAWISLMNPSNSECAITSFNSTNYFIQDFTNDKDLLISKLSSIYIGGRTDFDAALLNPVAGGAYVAASGVHKRVVIMLTDGKPSFEPDVTQIIAFASHNNIEIFAVILNLPCPESLQQICTATGGSWFENISTVDEATNAYTRAFMMAQEISPCTISWKSEKSCVVVNQFATLKLKTNGTQSTMNYVRDRSSVTNLEFTPSRASFQNIVPGKTVNKNISVVAMNGDYIIDSVVCTNPVFDINPKTFFLKSGDTIQMTVSCTPVDIGYISTEFKFYGLPCQQSLIAEVKSVPPGKDSVLKIITPNGGEVFLAGTDTTVSWGGNLDNSKIKLDYSIDDGRNWTMLDQNVTASKLLWKKIPKTPSNQCLMRITDLGQASPDSINFFKKLSRHTNRVLSAKFSPDGRRLLTTSSDNTAITWNVKTGGILNILGDNKYPVDYAEFSPDGTTIVTAAGNMTKLWEAASGFMIHVFPGFVLSAKFSPDSKLVAVTGYGTVKLYNLTDFNINEEISGSNPYVSYAEFSPDGKKLLTLESDQTVKIWDLAKNKLLLNLDGKMGAVKIAVFSPDGKYVLTAGDNSPIIWDAIYGTKLFELSDLSVNNRNVFSASFNSSGSRIVTAESDNNTKIWNSSTGDLIFTLAGHTDLVNYAAFSPDDKKVISASKDATSKIWDPESGLLLYTLDHNKDAVNYAGWSPDSKIIATASDDNSSDIWNMNNPYRYDISDNNWSIAVPEILTKNIDMGSVLLGDLKDSTITGFIVCNGLYKIRIDSVYLTGADANAFQMITAIHPIDLAPGDIQGIDIRFIPNRAGTHKAKINIVTPSDIIVQNIRGDGFEPKLEVVSGLIDFGKIEVGKAKDTLQALTIRNPGSTPVQITKTNHNIPNDVDFTTISGGGPKLLQPGETMKMDLRFSPSTTGRTSGMLEFFFNGDGSPAVIQLYGEGILKSPVIRANTGSFPDLVCSGASITNIDFANKGDKELIISNFEIAGPDKDDFHVIQSTPVIVEPDSVSVINISFQSDIPGNKSAVLEIRSNSAKDSILLIPLNARKESVSISLSRETVDLGYLCPGETKDTSISITNSGTIETSGALINSQNIELNSLNYKFNPKESLSTPFRFKGSDKEGAINETITYFDSTCGFTKNLVITGVVETPKISIPEITMNSNDLQPVESNLSIRNMSSRDITIDKPPVLSLPFLIVGDQFPLTIAAGSTVDIIIRYTPTDSNEISQSIVFDAQPCSISTKTTITGKINQNLNAARATITVGNISAYPGDKIEIPIILSNAKNIELSGATTLKADLSFNSTLLVPDFQSPYNITGDKGVVSLTNIPLQTGNDGNVLTLPFTAALGNKQSCDLVLGNLTANIGNVTLTPQMGTFTLLGICMEGGPRLINPNTFTGLLSVNPNPASSVINVDYRISLSGHSEIILVNVLGEKVKTLLSEDVTDYSLRSGRFDVHDVPAGQYLLIMRTPSVTDTRQIYVIN